MGQEEHRCEALCFALAVRAGQSPVERLPWELYHKEKGINPMLFVKWLVGKERNCKLSSCYFSF